MQTDVIRPFTIEVPETGLQDLRSRIAANRWPETGNRGRSVAGGAIGNQPQLFTTEERNGFRPLR